MRRRTPALLLLLLAFGAALPGQALAHPTQPLDRDHDGLDNAEDNCQEAFNPSQLDTDRDGVVGVLPPQATNVGGDACDTDDDGDAKDDAIDNCPLIVNDDQRDTDADGDGDLCDADDDADGLDDRRDNCVKASNPDQADHDQDFIGDACDPDAPKDRASAASRGLVSLGPPNPSDRTAPKLRLTRLGSSYSVTAIASGLPIEMSCDEACAVDATLSRAGARRATGAALLGTGAAAIGAAGESYLFVDIPAATRKRLRRTRGSTRAVLRLSVRDASGNTATSERKLRLTR